MRPAGGLFAPRAIVAEWVGRPALRAAASAPMSPWGGSAGCTTRPGQGDAAKVLEEGRRRLAVGPEHDELVAEAVEDARAGRRPWW